MEDEEDVDAESAPILMLEKDSDYIPNLFGVDCIQNQITKLDLSHYPKLRCLHTMPQGHPTTMSLRQTEVSTIQSKSGKTQPSCGKLCFSNATLTCSITLGYLKNSHRRRTAEFQPSK